MKAKTKGELYEEVLADFRSKNYKGTDLSSKWVSLDELRKELKDMYRKPKRFWFRGAELHGLAENDVAYNDALDDVIDKFFSPQASPLHASVMEKEEGRAKDSGLNKRCVVAGNPVTTGKSSLALPNDLCNCDDSMIWAHNKSECKKRKVK